MYNQSILNRFLSPRNVGLIKGADAVGDGFGVNAEQVKFYLKITDKQIVDAKFKIFGGVEFVVLFDSLAENLKGNIIDQIDEMIASDVVAEFSDFDGDTKQEFCDMTRELIENLQKDYTKKQLKLQRIEEKMQSQKTENDGKVNETIEIVENAKTGEDNSQADNIITLNRF